MGHILFKFSSRGRREATIFRRMMPIDTNNMCTEYVGRYLKLLDGGLKKAEAYPALQRMGYERSYKTLRRQIKTYERSGHALVEKRDTTARYALEEEQELLIEEWVLEQNANNIPFTLKHVQRLIYDVFEVRVCLKTCCNIMKRLELTLKRCQVKTTGFLLSNQQLHEMYMDFVVKARKTYWLSVHPSEIFSIDVTYSRKPTGVVTTYSPKEEGKQKSQNEMKNYTDGIVTCVSPDGKLNTPSMLYTKSPNMNPD